MPLLRLALATILLTLAGLTAFSATSEAGVLDLDADFGEGGIARTDDAHGGRWSALHVLADGGFLAAGRVTPDRVAVARFTAAGAAAPGFAADQPVPGVLSFGAGQGVTTPTDLIALGDGRVLVGWTAGGAGGEPSMRVARLTADGHLDPGFGAGGIATVTTSGGLSLGGIARQSSGAIVLAGWRTAAGSSSGVLARLTANGAVDAGFGSGGQIRVLLGGAGTRLNDVAVDGADRIVVTGWRASASGTRGQLAVARMTAEGAGDAGFGASGPGFTATDLDGASPATYDVEGRRLLLGADGRPLVAATVRAAGGGARLVGLARLTSTGALDPGFGAGGTATQDVSPSHVADVADLGPLPGGGFVVTGRTTVGPTVQVSVAGFRADGSPDPGLNPGHGDRSNATNLTIGDLGDDGGTAVALTPSGRLLVAGSSVNNARRPGFLLRLGGTAAAPLAAFGFSWPHTVADRPIRPGQVVTFDAGASSDPDGSIASYAWDLDGDGQTDQTGPTATRAYAQPGTVGVLLRVTDDAGLTSTTGATLTVAADKPPGVAIMQTGAAPMAGRSFSLQAIAGDSDGSVTSYAWDLDGNGSFETSTGASSQASTRTEVAGPLTVRVRVTDDEGASATDTETINVAEGPCADNPVLRIERAVIVTQGTANGGAGCFHDVTSDKAGIRTTRYTTTGHFRVNGIEVDTVGSSQAVLIWKRKIGTARTKKKAIVEGATTQLTLEAANAHVEGTSKGTYLAFRDGSVGWDLSGATIAGFKVDANAGIGGLPLKVSGSPVLDKDGTSKLDVLPGTPPELLGKTPDKPISTTFGPSANAAAAGDFSFKVDTIPLGVITLGPVTVTYNKAADRWDIAAKATMAVPVPTTLDGKLVLVKGKVKSVDLQFVGAITVGPLLITKVGLSIDFGPKVEANENCVKHVGLEDVTPYATWDTLDKLLPGYKAQVLAQGGPNQILFHKLYKDYKTPNFALCGNISLSVAKLMEAGVGFGFARYPGSLPSVFHFHGDAKLVEIIRATVDAQITTEGYVHLNAEVNGGYPEKDPWIGWELGLDFEYFKQLYNAEAYAAITIVPLDFRAGAQLLASSKGIAACLNFDTFLGEWNPGGGAKWGQSPTLYFFGCDVNDYKVVIKHALSGDIVIGPPVARRGGAGASRAGAIPTVGQVPLTGVGNEAGLVRLAGARPSLARRRAIRAAAAQAGPDVIEIPAGLPGTVMAFKGAGAPPHVILHGPKGERIDTGADSKPMRTPGVAALKNPRTGLTEVIVGKPSGGRWTVEVAPGSSRLVEALQADGTRPARITGRVVGEGHARRLQYKVTGLRNREHIDFAEVGPAAGRIIGRVSRDGAGTLPFRPVDGAPGRRQVQAIVTGFDGFPRDRLQLGTYKAPGPRRPAAARGVKVRRSGRSLVLTWRRDPAAKTVQVDLRASTGLNTTRIVRTARLKVPAPKAGTRLRLALTGTSRAGVVGRTARISVRAPAARSKPRRRSVRR